MPSRQHVRPGRRVRRPHVDGDGPRGVRGLGATRSSGPARHPVPPRKRGLAHPPPARPRQRGPPPGRPVPGTQARFPPRSGWPAAARTSLPTPAPVRRGARRRCCSSCTPSGEPGAGWTPGQFQGRAARRGYVVAYGIGAERSWDADGCCGWSNAHHAKDVEYLADVVADVRRRVPGIDARRVYLTGFSNGLEMMSLRALCERPHLFAAGVGVAGALVGRCRGGARPSTTWKSTGPPTRLYRTTEAGSTGCTRPFPPFSDLPGTIASRAPGSVVEIRSHPCGHVWPVGGRCRLDAATIGWEFLRRYALPSPAHRRAHRVSGAARGG